MVDREVLVESMMAGEGLIWNKEDCPLVLTRSSGAVKIDPVAPPNLLERDESQLIEISFDRIMKNRRDGHREESGNSRSC
jgi:hypothetical protein